jgi:hypothetical protein
MPHMAGTAAGRGDGHHGSDHVTTLALAERMRRARHRLDSPLVSRSHRYLQSTPPAPFQHRMSITTIERARNYCSTGIAPSRTRSGHAESEGSSPPRKSARLEAPPSCMGPYYFISVEFSDVMAVVGPKVLAITIAEADSSPSPQPSHLA